MVRAHVIAYQLLDVRHLVHNMQGEALFEQLDLALCEPSLWFQSLYLDGEDVTVRCVTRASDAEVPAYHLPHAPA